MSFRMFVVALALAMIMSLPVTLSHAAGKSDAPGQAARDCAKEADPKAKDDCVRAAREASKKDKKQKGKKDKSEKDKGKKKSKDKKDKDKGKKKAKDKGDKKDKKKDKKGKKKE